MVKGIFYFVATPIGNLADISQRALTTLGSVDVIACEDIRHSLKLLNFYSIKKPLINYHRHNYREAGDDIIKRLNSGQSVALITDAGTPGISDPGQEIVPLLVQNGIDYTIIPGTAAFLNALVLSGFDSSKFIFAGFIPQNNAQRKEFLQELSSLQCTIILYSAPHDVAKDIKLLYGMLGDRRFAAVREITKIYEQVVFSTLSVGLKEVKGEYVLVIEKAEKPENDYKDMDIKQHIKYYLDSGLKPAEAVKSVAKDRNLPKAQIYPHYIEIKENQNKA